ncbi:hypothetical protein BGX20_008352 [Mortierella sp. AD010]|nr:hypothetical protein BGX20_008352 [Mortierella sp. AD010]
MWTASTYQYATVKASNGTKRQEYERIKKGSGSGNTMAALGEKHNGKQRKTDGGIASARSQWLAHGALVDQ